MAKPAHAPDYRLSVDGTVITPRVRGRLECLTLSDERGQESDRLEITLTDHDRRLALPTRGAEISLALGWTDQGLVDRGLYIVDEVEHSGAPDKLIISAHAANLRETMPTKRTQSWHDVSVADIVQTIAKRNDLTPRVSAALADKRIEHMDQTEESDMHFLTRLGKRFDAIAAVKVKNLLFMPTGEAQTVSGQAITPVSLNRKSGDHHSYKVTDRDAYSGVIAYWSNVAGAQKERVVIGTADNAKILREAHSREQDARDAATAEWGRIQRGKAQLTLTLANGRAGLYPETPVTVSGFKAEIDATPWLLTKVMHNFTEQSYTCELTLEVQV